MCILHRGNKIRHARINLICFIGLKVRYFCLVDYRCIIKTVEIRNTRILILGGSGLVGRTIARSLLRENPKTIIIHSKTKEETKLALKTLRLPESESAPRDYRKARRADSGNRHVIERVVTPNGQTKFIGEWGDIFDADFLSPLSSKILKNSYLYKLILKYQPDIIIDAVNSATAIAYQNLFEKARLVSENLSTKNVRALLDALYIPKLVRHIQVLYEAVKSPTSGHAASVEGEPRSTDQGGLLERVVTPNGHEENTQNSVKLYLKIGTTGTGGMGFNIPFTHGEEKPSRMLLSKSALAGAQSQLLYLLSKTPGAPKIIELKPATSIAWGKLGYGSIKNISLRNSRNSTRIKIGHLFKGGKSEIEREKLTSSFVDSGENGLFSPEEFRTLTDQTQMGFITPEEITTLAIAEIKGQNTGNNIAEALEKSVLQPSKKAQNKKGAAFTILKTLRQGREDSPALSFLGPPRLSKLLFEARIIKKSFGDFNNFLKADTTIAISKAEKEISEKTLLRRFAITAGLPILLKSGTEVICGESYKVPEKNESQKITQKNINNWARRGWIDLRESNFRLWQKRIARFILENGKAPKFEGEMAAFIFKTEDGGFRKK